MRATLVYAAQDVRVEDVADPKIQKPTDAVVRVVLSCVCGSDLWPYKSLAPTDNPRHLFLTNWSFQNEMCRPGGCQSSRR